MRAVTAFHHDRLAEVDALLPAELADLQAVLDAAPGLRCRDVGPEQFFPPEGSRFPRHALLAERERLRALCGDCPVRVHCLATALVRGETYGSWGAVAQPDYQLVRSLWRGRDSTSADRDEPGGIPEEMGSGW
ncbi:WhiB family transcriptional regulator [Actinokineospora cianjurensis]|uniref:Transcriptional regulator WhiB n=1 Tax=Actinokineospora cianjurensis TaxID=585224 RepID=A0A421B1S0_9PSEU|nr:WhiB family transcriptional regulator [Actinokineospora cianjurensis]RLK58369.1 transcription factor WhiB [Actinokineospora cianjurensis]